MKHPISIFEVKSEIPTITRMKFSNDGKVICLVAADSQIVIIDAYRGTELKKFTDLINEYHNPVMAEFSPCSTYILTAGEDKFLHFWNW